MSTIKNRIVSLDIIRGIALFGILFINVAGFSVVTGDVLVHHGAVNEWIAKLITILVEKKFYSIFSFLFGAGFYLFVVSAEKRNGKPIKSFIRRLLSLLLIGIIQFFFFWGTVLPIYAIIGFLLIPFYRCKVKTIAIWISVFISYFIIANSLVVFSVIKETNTLAAGIDDSLNIFILFLLGLLAAKANLFTQISNYKKQISLVCGCSFLLSLITLIPLWINIQNGDNTQYALSLNVIPMTIFYLTALFLLLENQKLQKWLKPIANIGKMALTNYFLQSFIGLAIFNIINIESYNSSPKQIVAIACSIYLINILLSAIWLRFFNMGPLEKLWRWMTYGKKQKETLLKN